MKHFISFDDPELEEDLRNDAIGILPTDTLYGLVGKALVVPTVERIYDIRKRSLEKPLIVLISELDDLDIFFAERNKKINNFLKNVWPGKISVILNIDNEQLDYLHRGTDTLAFRIPDNPELVKLISKVGPLVAPSANQEGKSPAHTVKDAQEYFSDQVDFYFDKGTLVSEPSTLVRLDLEANPTVMRNGAVKL